MRSPSRTTEPPEGERRIVGSVPVHELADRDLYRTLGVAPDASDDEIARAYRALAKQLHPDAVRDAARRDAQTRFARVAAAYEVLRDPDRRHDYDLTRAGVVRASPTRLPAAGVPARPTFRAPTRSTQVRWTPARARATLVSGVVCALLGVVVCVGVLAVMASTASARRDDIAVTATRFERDGESFVRFRTASGELVEAPEPDAVNPETRGLEVALRYDAADPTDVSVDESTLARDLTILIVGVKLLVAGPVFAVVGRRRLRATGAR